jgi:hypothetical protein
MDRVTNPENHAFILLFHAAFTADLSASGIGNVELKG